MDKKTRTSWDITNPERDGSQRINRQKAEETVEKVARDSRAETSNGNRETLEKPSSDQLGGAEKGGPDLSKARNRRPPDAKI